MYSDEVCELLLSESTVTDLVSAYGTDSYGIFNFDPAPIDSGGTLITVVDSSNTVEDARITDGGRINLTIKIWGDKDYDQASLFSLADIVRSFLHRNKSYSEGNVIMGIIDYPQFTIIDGYPLALMTLTLLVHE